MTQLPNKLPEPTAGGVFCSAVAVHGFCSGVAQLSMFSRKDIMKSKQRDFRAWHVLAGLVLSPSVAWAHDPEGYGFAACVSFPIAIVLGFLLARAAWKLGRKFTANRSGRVSFIVSFVAAVVVAVFGFMIWPLFWGVAYWVYGFIR